MTVATTLTQIGKYESLGEMRDVYLELRGALSQQGVTLPPYSAIESAGVDLSMSQSDLEQMLADARPDVQAVVKRSDEIGAHSATVVAYAAVVIGLAVLSKLSYSKEKGWELKPGLPGLADVLGKLKFPGS